MPKIRLFTSFDFDNDEDLRNLLIGQARNPDSPFDVADWSLKEPLAGDWREKVRRRIRVVDQVCVICGTQTDTATGVNAELQIARDETKTYFLLQGRRDKLCKKPGAALPSDKMYEWTWDNLKKLIAGSR
jgi:hypothetical protein